MFPHRWHLLLVAPETNVGSFSGDSSSSSPINEMALLTNSATAAVGGIAKVIKLLLAPLMMSHSQIVHEFVNQSMNANQIKADFLCFLIFNEPLEGASFGSSLVKMQNFLISTQFALSLKWPACRCENRFSEASNETVHKHCGS